VRRWGAVDVVAFWSINKTTLLTPEIVRPISDALVSVPHRVEWSNHDDVEQVLFVNGHAKIQVWANYRDRHGTASIMRPQTEPFEPSNEVVPLERLVDFNDEHWEDYQICFDNQQKLMGMYGLIVEKYAIPYFLGAADFDLLCAFNQGFSCAYTGHCSGRFG
jgi:hypothetical protein